MAPEDRKNLSVNWGNGVGATLSVSKKHWSRIERGDAVTIRGKGYHYEGCFFRDYWDFSGGLDGQLIVRYGSPKDGDYSGQGFIGTPREAIID